MIRTELRSEVAIIGGGLVGCAAALFLRRAGLSVTVLERDRCGLAASGINYGGVRVQGREPVQLPLALRARHWWEQLPGLIGTDGEYQRTGHLKLARSLQDLQALVDYAARVAPLGLPLQILDAAECRKRFDWLGEPVAGASWSPADGQANPRLVSAAFAQAAGEAGATIVEDCRVTQFAHDGHHFDVGDGQGLTLKAPWLLNCAGAWGDTVAAAYGDALPMTPIHPMMLVTEAVPAFLQVNVGMEGGGLYARQTSGGHCVVGGRRGQARSTLYAQPDPQAAGELCARMVSLFKPLRDAQVLRFWSGTEGATPDQQPIIGRSLRHPQLLHAVGFSGAGFQIAPAVGEALAQWVQHGPQGLGLAPFALERFLPRRPQETA